MSQSSKLSPSPGSQSPRSTILAARRLKNPFTELSLPQDMPLTPGKPSLCLSYHTGKSASDAQRAWMFGGIESSLKHLYVHPGMKWDAREKQRDFRHKLQRFLIVHDGESDMDVAFVSFRWDIEEGVVVMYVYELFVEQSHRGLGIARKLMSRAEELCLLVDVEKIMLTVFESNTSAMHLYREKLSYVIDESSPSQYDIHDTGYEILHKRLSKS